VKVLLGTKSSRQEARGKAPLVNADLLQRALHWVIDAAVFRDVRRHGNTTWTVVPLVSLAVLWVWSDRPTLTEGFAQAHQLALRLFGTAAVRTYQGLTKALLTWTDRLLPLLWEQLHQRMEECGAAHWRLGVWVPLAADGSRVSTPRTASNETAYSARTYGRGKTARSRKNWANQRRRRKKLGQPVRPQIWLTLVWHMGLKMPWAWQTGPSTASERDHFVRLLRELKFPDNTLFCGDAGFVGYELWSTILAGGHHFLIRVGANVRLLRRLGRVRRGRGIVYLWPKEAARTGQPPLVLRLLEFQGPRGTIALVSSVLSDAALSESQARQLYRMRWGIELQFRAFKQTFGRGTLRARSAGCAAVELQWSLVGLWMIQLFAVKEQIAVEIAPGQSSVALALGVIRDLMRDRNEVATRRTFRERMRRAVHDSYRRRGSKRARYRSGVKEPPSAQRPKITLANRQQRAAFRALEIATAKNR
jgi:DDE family transposase